MSDYQYWEQNKKDELECFVNNCEYKKDRKTVAMLIVD